MEWILILGSKGMLGQALAAEFFGYELLLWDKEEIDVTKPEDLRFKILDLRNKPEAIINCAAFTDVDGCEDNPELAEKLNAQAPAHLAEIANHLGAILVQYSTAYVFDGQNPNGYDEQAPTRPLSVYGKTKLEGEAGAALAGKHYILRLDRLFGKAGYGKKSFVDKMLELSCTERQIKVISDEYGCPTYAPDLAKVTRSIIEQSLSNGIYHVTNAGACSWYEWASEIFKIQGIEVELVKAHSSDFPRKAVRPKYGILLNTRLPKLRNWQEALKEYLLKANS